MLRIRADVCPISTIEVEERALLTYDKNVFRATTPDTIELFLCQAIEDIPGSSIEVDDGSSIPDGVNVGGPASPDVVQRMPYRIWVLPFPLLFCADLLPQAEGNREKNDCGIQLPPDGSFHRLPPNRQPISIGRMESGFSYDFSDNFSFLDFHVVETTLSHVRESGLAWKRRMRP